MRRSRVASGSERSKMTSRTPASSCSWASPRSPPITIAAGLKKFTEPGEHLPERAAGLAHHADGERLPGAHERARRRGCRRPPARPRLSRRASARPPAIASRQPTLPQRHSDLLVARHADVADVARRALGAAVDLPPGHDPAADARADLDEQQVVGVAPVREVLAQGHDVHVVVDQHRRRVAVREPVRDREAVPAGHDRRVDRLPRRERDRAGDADADAAHVLRGLARPSRAAR